MSNKCYMIYRGILNLYKYNYLNNKKKGKKNNNKNTKHSCHLGHDLNSICPGLGLILHTEQ